VKGGIAGTALIRESEAHPGTFSTASDSFTMFFDFNRRGTRPYRFLLEVRVPDSEPCEVEGEFKVPKKAELTGLFSTASALNAGIELPVFVDPSDPRKVEIDWKAYMAKPGRKQEKDDARTSRQAELMRAELAKKPKLQQKMWAQNKMAAAGWVSGVKMGNLSREEFEQTIQAEVDNGRMDPADAEAARAELDG
jgi:hypothetical protein